MLQINTLTRLDLGVKQENLARDLYIDMSAWISEYPNGTITVWHKRNGDETKYAVGGVTFDRDTNILKWTPTAYDTFYTGSGLAEIRLTENDVIKKTKDIVTEVARSLMLGSGETLESGWQNIVNTVSGYASDAQDAADDAADAQDAAEDAQEAAEDAQAAAEDARDAAQAAAVHEPTIDDTTGNWMVWDQDSGAYVDTGVHAQGPQGEPGSVENVRATGIKMSMLDDTTVYDAIQARANKVTGGTENNFAALDANGNLKDSGHKHSDYLTSHQDISGKADKVSSGTENNFAALDANGNLKDSGHKHSDYLTSHQDISGKADKVTGGTENNFAALDANGNLKDSGKKAGDFLTPSNIYNGLDKTTTGSALDAAQGYALNSDVKKLKGYGNITVTDFNSMTETGIYEAKGASNTVHSPVPSVPTRWYILSVMNDGNSFISQTAYWQDNGNIYTRVYDGTTWTSWVSLSDQIATIGEIVTGTNAQSLEVQPSSSSDVCSLSVTKGTWIIIGGFQWSSSFTSLAIGSIYAGSSTIQPSTVRHTGQAGGGCNIAVGYRAASTTAITLRAYNGDSSAHTVSAVVLQAIRVGL